MLLLLAAAADADGFWHNGKLYCHPGYKEEGGNCVEDAIAGNVFKYCSQSQYLLGTFVQTAAYNVLSDGSFCQYCPLGWATQNNTCIDTEQVAFCDLYNLQGECAKCEEGYSVVHRTEGKYSCEQVLVANEIKNCNAWDANDGTVCKRCAYGYKLLADGKSCEAVEKCDLAAPQSGECTVCQNDLYYNAATEKCMRGCGDDEVFLCAECEEKNMAYFNCKTYDFSEGTCEESCKECYDGYYKYENKSFPEKLIYGCMPCEKDTQGNIIDNRINVTKCELVDTVFIATECKPYNRFLENSDHSIACEETPTCAKPINAEECELDMCATGYGNSKDNLKCRILGDTLACGELIPGCATCTLWHRDVERWKDDNLPPYQCSRCEHPMKLSSDLRNCTDCKIAHCARCDENAALPETGEPAAIECTECEQGWELNEGQCTVTPRDIPFCLLKNGPTQYCTQCAPGFAVSPDGACYYIHGCKVLGANAENQPTCEDSAGNDEYIEIGGITTTFSKKWNPDCEAYGSYLQCAKCKQGTFMDQALICQSEIAPCSDADAFSLGGETGESGIMAKYSEAYDLLQHCKACVDGHYLRNGICEPCNDGTNRYGIAECEFDGVTVTPIACLAGFYLDGETSTCEMCPYGCAACASGAQCTACDEGLFLSTRWPDATYCESCQDIYGASCYTCSDAECLTHEPRRSQCYSKEYTEELCGDENCVRCNEASEPDACTTNVGRACGECKEGYYLDDEYWCTSCKQISAACTECGPKDGRIQCSKCTGGMAPNEQGTECVSCFQRYMGARICTQCDETGCLEERCDAGLKNGCTSFVGQCTENCQVCAHYNGSDQCIVCDQGYAVNLATHKCFNLGDGVVANEEVEKACLVLGHDGGSGYVCRQCFTHQYQYGRETSGSDYSCIRCPSQFGCAMNPDGTLQPLGASEVA